MAEGYEPQPVADVEVFNIRDYRLTEYLSGLGTITRYGRVVNWNIGAINVTTQIPQYTNILTEALPVRFRPQSIGVSVIFRKHNDPTFSSIIYVGLSGQIQTQETIPTGAYYGSACWIA